MAVKNDPSGGHLVLGVARDALVECVRKCGRFLGAGADEGEAAGGGQEREGEGDAREGRLGRVVEVRDPPVLLQIRVRSFLNLRNSKSVPSRSGARGPGRARRSGLCDIRVSYTLQRPS